MRYDTTNKRILGKWKYQAKYAFTYKTKFKFIKEQGRIKYEQWNVEEEANYIAAIDLFLSHKASDEWVRYGNNIYLMSLADIFHLRLFHENGLKSILECLD